MVSIKFFSAVATYVFITSYDEVGVIGVLIGVLFFFLTIFTFTTRKHIKATSEALEIKRYCQLLDYRYDYYHRIIPMDEFETARVIWNIETQSNLGMKDPGGTLYLESFNHSILILFFRREGDHGTEFVLDLINKMEKVINKKVHVEEREFYLGEG